MTGILKAYLREQASRMCMYVGFVGIFYVVFHLYNLPGEAVRYAFLLSFVWLLAYGVVGFVKCVRKQKLLLAAEKQTDAGPETLPEAESAEEAVYQRILKKLYSEKLELESDARMAKQEMADYYGLWAHQIKTPIAALRLLLQVQEQLLAEQEALACPKENLAGGEFQAKENREKQAKITREMKLELFKTEQYVEMVLTYLRVGDMSSDFSFAPCSLDKVIRQAVKKYSQMFISKKIRLCYQPTERTVVTDEKWLAFVLEQLLSNALKYTKEGSVSIYMAGEELVIEDTGIGICPEDLPRIFEKGFTGYNGRKDKKSTGIGLYLCKTVLDKLECGIRLESEEGRGTKVYVTFL